MFTVENHGHKSNACDAVPFADWAHAEIMTGGRLPGKQPKERKKLGRYYRCRFCGCLSNFALLSMMNIWRSIPCVELRWFPLREFIHIEELTSGKLL
jgi:hypothetical protein